jgi:vancomycin permeability regulator SanA
MKRVLLAAAGLAIAAVAIPNLIVRLGGSGPVTSDPARVPHAQAALVLGAQVEPDVVTGAGPRFLGARIPITGDGRRSWRP